MPPGVLPAAPTPPRPSRRVVLLAIAVVLLCVAGGTYLYVNRDRTGADAIAAASDRLYDQDATKVHVTYSDPDGESISGDFTLDDDLHAAGTITDPVAGSAELVEYTAYSAVRGDADWWARRDPDQAGTLATKWVEPSVDAFPVEISSSFNPTALGYLLTRFHDQGTVIPVEDEFRGRRVIGMTWEGWTALVTAQSPHTLVWIGGPISESGPIKPVAWTPPARSGATTTVRTVYAFAPSAVAQPPYVSVAVDPAEKTTAKAVQDAVAAVIPEAAEEDGGPAPAEVPAQGSTVARAPNFVSSLDISDCSTPTCSWTVTVTNTGTASGRVFVVATASPGMPTRTLSIGSLKPGESRRSARMTFANPAPKVTGKSTQVQVSYNADLFSPDLAGASRATIDRLRSRGIEVPAGSVLDNVDAAQKSIAYQALDVMSSRPGFRPDKVLSAVENAFRQNAVLELQTLTQSGRLDNPQDLAEKLDQLSFEIDPDPTGTQPDKGKIGFRREVQMAVTTLRTDPRARVLLDGLKRVGDRDYQVDLLVERPGGTEAYQIKTVSSGKLIGNLGSALRQLNGRNRAAASTGVAEQAPPGSKRIALIYLEPSRDWIHDSDRAGLARKLTGNSRSAVLQDWCVNGTAQADEVVIVNSTGTHRWTKEQFNDLLGVSGQCA